MRSTSVPTVVLLNEIPPIDTGHGLLVFKDLVPTPPRHLLPGFGTAQILVQCEDEQGNLVELTVPEAAVLFQSAHSPSGSPTRRTLFPDEAATYASDERLQEMERLTRLLKDFEDGQEVCGVRLPAKGGGRAAARERFAKELERIGFSAVSPASQNRRLQMLQSSGWDATVLLRAKDLMAPLDPLLREKESLVVQARKFMTGVQHLVEPSVSSLVRDFAPWLLSETGQTLEEAGFSRSACRRVLAELARPYRVGSDVSTSDSKRARPKNVQGRMTASLPYEGLQIDAWTVDCLALDQYGKAVRLFLMAALDSVVKKMRAVRFCAHEPTMQDIKLLIFDTVKGAPIWPVGEPACPRLPDFVDLGERVVAHLVKEDPDYKPVGMIHVDNGAAMIGSDSLEAARSVAIHVQVARPGKGSDKGGIESVFDTLAALARQLPGAVGSKSTRRPRQILRLLSVPHLELFIRLWLEVVYHERPHSGLRDPRFPNLNMTPNSFEAHLLLTHGVIAVSASPFAAVGLLPMVSRSGSVSSDTARPADRPAAPGKARSFPTRRVAHDEGFRNRNRDYDSEDTSRLKEYTQGAMGVGLVRRPVTVYEHPGDPAAIIVRDVNGDLVVVPHRDLLAPELPLADELERDLRALLLMPAPAPTAEALRQRTERIVAAARALSEPMPKRGATSAVAETDADGSDEEWAAALRAAGA